MAAVNGIAFGGGLGAWVGIIGSSRQAHLSGQPELSGELFQVLEARTPAVWLALKRLDMIVGGDPVRAEKAVELGIADELAGEDLLARAIAYALEKVADGPRPTGGITSRLGALIRNILKQAQNRCRTQGQEAPWALMLLKSLRLKPFEGFGSWYVVGSRRRQIKSHAAYVFAEREVAKIPGITRQTPVQKLKKRRLSGPAPWAGVSP